MAQNDTLKTRILLTGAAGGIGSAFFLSMHQRYHFRLADIIACQVDSALLKAHDVITLDIGDLDACRRACKDIDVVVHLAAITDPDAEFDNTMLSTNIQGTYHIFRAAKDCECQRVVFASSAQVFSGYPSDVQAHVESPMLPMNMYGVTKCFGEAVASYFAHAEGLSSIVVRIGAYDVRADDANWLRQDPNVLNLSGYVSERDLNQLFVRCIEVPSLPFAIVHGLSNNRFKRLDIASTKEIVSYEPEDDSFELFQADLSSWLRD